MNTAVMLFGLNLAPLFAAIAQVESDRGATSANVYQIRDIYVEDVNRVAHTNYQSADKFDPAKAEAMMVAYWGHYGRQYRRDTGRTPTYETLARIHNGGPHGWAKTATVAYWAKVKAQLAKATAQ